MSEGNFSSSQGLGQPPMILRSEARERSSERLPEAMVWEHPQLLLSDSKLILMQKFVIEDGCRQFVRVFDIFNRTFAANQPALAEYIAVLLAGDFFGHLEDQFYQRIRRQLLRSLEQYARLADVLDQALIPGTEIFPTVPNRKLRS
jgi:hypothetical protein